MASMMGRLARLARSPQGQKLARRAQEYANSPAGKRRVEDVRRRVSKKGR